MKIKPLVESNNKVLKESLGIKHGLRNVNESLATDFPEDFEEAQEIIDNLDTYVADVDKSNLKNGFVSVLIKDRNSNFSAWVDCQKDEYGDVVGDWNQYIFFTNSSDDRIQEMVQDSNIAFEKCVFLAENEVASIFDNQLEESINMYEQDIIDKNVAETDFDELTKETLEFIANLKKQKSINKVNLHNKNKVVTPEVIESIKEYIDFCSGVPQEEAIEYIVDNISYDYDLPKDTELYNLVGTIYNKKLNYIQADNNLKVASESLNESNNDRHIIWSSDIGNLDDWRDGYREELENDGFDKEEIEELVNDDEKVFDFAYDTNNSYLDDERDNLGNIIYDDGILVLGDIGRWNGRVNGYKIIESGKVSDCLYDDGSNFGNCEWFVDNNGEFRFEGAHHDGTNYYTYRAIGCTPEEFEDLEDKIYDGVATQEDIDRCTYKIGPDIAKVYGWNVNEALNESEKIYHVMQDYEGYTTEEFSGTWEECQKWIEEAEAEQESLYGDEFPEFYISESLNEDAEDDAFEKAWDSLNINPNGAVYSREEFIEMLDKIGDLTW